MHRTSKIDIWNMALARIGGAYIKQSAFEPAREARMCELFYPQVLKSLLSSHHFGFARKVAALALKPNAWADKGIRPEGVPYALCGHAPYALTFEYAYPEDALKIWDVRTGQDCNLSWFNFMRQYEVQTNSVGEKIIRCAWPAAYAMYSYMELDTTRYSPLFTEALHLALAQKLCGALSNDQRLAQALSQEAAMALDAVMSADANESFTKQPISEYIAAGLDSGEYGY